MLLCLQVSFILCQKLRGYILEHDGSIIYIILQSFDSGTVGYVGAYFSIRFVIAYYFISEGKKIFWLLAINFFF